MQKVLSVAAAAFICGLGSIASADLLYNETFSTDGPISGYTGADKVFASVSGTSGISVAGGKLTMGFVTVSSDSIASAASSLGAERSVVSMKLDLTPTSYSAGRITLIAGGTADLPWVSWNFGERSFGYLSVSENGISIQGGANLPFTMNETHTLTLYLNNSGASQAFVGPDGGSYSVADQSWSVFGDATPLAQNVGRAGSTVITHVGLLATRNWEQAQTMTDIDNLVIRDDLAMYPVPEPTSVAVLALSGMALLNRRRMR